MNRYINLLYLNKVTLSSFVQYVIGGLDIVDKSAYMLVRDTPTTVKACNVRLVKLVTSRKLDLNMKQFDHTVHGDMIEVSIAVRNTWSLSLIPNITLLIAPP